MVLVEETPLLGETAPHSLVRIAGQGTCEGLAVYHFDFAVEGLVLLEGCNHHVLSIFGLTQGWLHILVYENVDLPPSDELRRVVAYLGRRVLLHQVRGEELLGTAPRTLLVAVAQTATPTRAQNSLHLVPLVLNFIELRMAQLPGHASVL